MLATAFSGIIAAGVFAGLQGVRGLAGWQWLFIIAGAGSFAAAVAAFGLLPDYVESESGAASWLLSAKEREVAAQRMALDRLPVPQAERSLWQGVLLAAKDVYTWFFASRDPHLSYTPIASN